MKTLYALTMASVIGLASVAFAQSPAFEDLDTDRSGTLSESEAAGVDALDCAQADTNHDGSLDRAEFEAAIG
jgi:hypothetical protein